MSPVANLLKAIAGVLLLLIISFPRLTSMDIEQKRELCESRRQALTRESFPDPGNTTCPFGDVPYLYTMAGNGGVQVVCPNGDGRPGLPRDRWVRFQ